MQLTHVSTNLRQGLRRNLSMHVAVVLTLFVSLTLAGIGLMLNKQADKTSEVLGDQLKLIVYFCVPDDASNPDCTGEVTDQQKQAIADAVSSNPDVKGYYFESKQTGLDKIESLIGDKPFSGPHPAVTIKDIPQSLWITLDDPHQYQAVLSQVQGLDGFSSYRSADELVGPVFRVIDFLKYGSYGAAALLILAAILLVANTIRLAALARRREIEIMRLVGASRIFIALPFLLEALVTALIGVLLAGGALAAFMEFVVIRQVDAHNNALPFIHWPEYWSTMWVVAIAGPVLTVVPTLLLTRKYLRL